MVKRIEERTAQRPISNVEPQNAVGHGESPNEEDQPEKDLTLEK